MDELAPHLAKQGYQTENFVHYGAAEKGILSDAGVRADQASLAAGALRAALAATTKVRSGGRRCRRPDRARARAPLISSRSLLASPGRPGIHERLAASPAAPPHPSSSLPPLVLLPPLLSPPSLLFHPAAASAHAPARAPVRTPRAARGRALHFVRAPRTATRMSDHPLAREQAPAPPASP